MSQQTPPQTAGEGPNPLELFFEKNKKWIYVLAGLLVLALAANYGVKQWQQAKINKQWSDFTAVTGVADAFRAPVELPAMPPQMQSNPQMQQYIQFQQFQAIASRQRELVTKLMDDVRNANLAEIDKLVGEAKGDSRVPWLHWVAANKLYGEGKWAEAKARCEKLKSEFASHILCAESEYPPQVRSETEEAKKKRRAEAKKKESKKRPSSDEDEDAKLTPPKKGSPVGNLLAAIASDEAFRKANAQFYEVPEPDSSETAVIKLADHGELVIAFYPDAAKRHVEEFKKNITSGYYKDMRVHKIKRKPKNRGDENTPKTLHLGNPKSKEENREEWSKPVEDEEKDMLEFESGMKSLSFFPYMVAAEQAEDGKSSARRFFICTNDCAATMDGDYVIFGRVISGTEHVDEIVDGNMADLNEEDAGEGRPSVDVKVEATELRKK